MVNGVRPATTKPKTPCGYPRTGASFRKRYDDLEHQRTLLVARLEVLGERGREHPNFERALKLLNNTFRKSSLAQRLGILQAASWTIGVLEKVTLSTQEIRAALR